MNRGNFFSELKRRNVYKVAVAYAVVGWLVIQIASTILPTFHAPEWVVQTLVVLVALGFPVALVIAWAFEMTPEGIKRTEDVVVAKRPKKHTWLYVVGLGAVLSIGLFLLGRYTGRNNARADSTAAAVISSIPQKSIAVLPFENLSDDKSATYFADGIQDEILTKLASIADLKVISRTSTAKYQSKPEDLKTVSQQLGVATVLEGSVQRSGDKVRVNVQLIDARADTHLWAKSYDGDAKDVFGVESEVSQQVADALRAKLSPAEAQVLAKAPTQDPEAYDFFLKGEYEARQAQSLVTADWFDRADADYRCALIRDPNFALAAARLAENKLLRHWFLAPIAVEELNEVKTFVDRALALAPDLAESHVALGTFYYWGLRQYEPALAEFRRAIELQPSLARAIEFCGYVDRRQGRWERSMSELTKAAELDPRDAAIPQNIGTSYVELRQWKDARAASLRALALDPQITAAKRILAMSYVNENGNIAEAKRVVADVPANARLTNNTERGSVAGVIDDRAYLDVLERDFAAALKHWDTDSTDSTKRMNRLAARAAIRVLAGDAGSDTAASEEARTLLEARLREHWREDCAMTQLSWVYLALGRPADALHLAAQAAQALPIETDRLAGAVCAAGQAEIQARTGEPQQAIETLRYLLSIPAGQTISIHRLKIDPVWDPLRNDSEFQKLLTMKEHVGP
jgi:TolB-like protein/Flp pilus assembly protein TadD